jgi:hypothetical protein
LWAAPKQQRQQGDDTGPGCHGRCAYARDGLAVGDDLLAVMGWSKGRATGVHGNLSGYTHAGRSEGAGSAAHTHAGGLRDVVGRGFMQRAGRPLPCARYTLLRRTHAASTRDGKVIFRATGRETSRPLALPAHSGVRRRGGAVVKPGQSVNAATWRVTEAYLRMTKKRKSTPAAAGVSWLRDRPLKPEEG